MIDLFGLGEHAKRIAWSDPFHVRRVVCQRRLKGDIDETKRALLEHTLKRIRSEEVVAEIAKSLNGELHA